MEVQPLNYESLCYGARLYASRLNYYVDWRDLAHEAVVKRLRGRKFAQGAMKDLVSRRPLFGRIRPTIRRYRYQIVSTEELFARRTPGPPLSEGLILARLQRRIEGLPPGWRTVLDRHYWGGLNFEEIAAEMGVTPPRVSQLHKAAILALRDWALFPGPAT